MNTVMSDREFWGWQDSLYKRGRILNLTSSREAENNHMGGSGHKNS